MKLELVLQEKLSDMVFISGSKSHIKLQKENIQFIEVKDPYIIVHTIRGNHRQVGNLQEFMKQFENDHEFVSISDTMIVNLNYVDSIIRYTLFIGIREFRVTEKYREAIFGVN